MRRLIAATLLAVCVFGQALVPNPVGAPVFAGTGTNNMSAGGQTTSNINLAYTVTIAATATKFGWSASDGGSGTNISILGGSCAVPYTTANGWQVLSHGISACFLTSSGHVTGDQWTFAVNVNGTIAPSTTVQPGAGAITRSAQDKFRDVINIKDFGAKVDGVTDDAAAWNAALASAAGHKATVMMPIGTSHIGSTINISGDGQEVVGQGRNSIISGSGFPLVQMSGTTLGGQMLRDITITDPIGNSSTIGILLDNGSGSVNQATLQNVSLFGVSGIELGIGIKINGSVNVHLDTVVDEYFQLGLLTANAIPGNTTLRLDRSTFYLNGLYGVDLETSGEVSAYGTDFESNGSEGIHMGIGAQTLTLVADHFENNPSSQVNITGGNISAYGNTWVAGTITVGPGGSTQFTSMNEQMGSVTLVNNATAAFGAEPPVVFFYPYNGPTLSGSGWSRFFDRTGQHDFNNPGVRYLWEGAPFYEYHAPLLVNNGVRFTVANNGGACTASTPTGFVGTSTSGYFSPGNGAAFPLTCQYTMFVGAGTPITAPSGWQITGTNTANGVSVSMVGTGPTAVNFSVPVTGGGDIIFISAHDPF